MVDMTDPTLHYGNLTGGYGTTPIIQNVTGSVHAGCCLCILGRNGVGKSTLLKLLSGHLPVMSGDIRLDGRSIGHASPETRWRYGISTGLQDRPVFDRLTVRDNLILMQSDRCLDGFERYFDAFPIIKQRLNQLAGTLSGGERKILSFVRALKENALLTLLDEPSAGVQLENVDRMAQLIHASKSKGCAFLIVEQHLHLAEEIADAYQVLDNGRVSLEGMATEVSLDDLIKHILV